MLKSTCAPRDIEKAEVIILIGLMSPYIVVNGILNFQRGPQLSDMGKDYQVTSLIINLQ